MRLFFRTRSTAAVALLVFLIAFQPMIAAALPMNGVAEKVHGTEALDVAATPVISPELPADGENGEEVLPDPMPEEDPGEPVEESTEGKDNSDPAPSLNWESASPARKSAPLATGDAFNHWIYPENIYGLPGVSPLFVGAVANTEGIDFGVPEDTVLFQIGWSLQGSDGTGIFNMNYYSEIPQIVELRTSQIMAMTNSLAANCAINNGNVILNLTFYIWLLPDQTQTLFETHSTQQAIPCSTAVTPLPPLRKEARCGPGTDVFALPSQPKGVIVTDSGWIGTQRSFTYSNADWAIFPSDFNLVHTFDDTDPPCDADVTITAPVSLPPFPTSKEFGVTVEYDYSEIWPSTGSAGFEIKLDDYNATSRQFISDPSGTYTYEPWWVIGDVTPYCIGDNGLFSTNVTVNLFPMDSNFTGTPLWTTTKRVETRCSIAVHPKPVTYIAEECGYTDARIVVPYQAGITGHSITWNDNVATIEYTPMPVYEIVGGPFTVTVTEDPCVTEMVPAPTQNHVCGIANDRITIPDLDGVAFDTSEGWSDDTFRVSISPLPGWVLPEEQVTRFTLVDPGDCEAEGLNAPVHTEVCGINNDIVQMPQGVENVTITTTGDMAANGSVTVTYTPAEHHQLPPGVLATYTFVDKGDCLVTPVVSGVPVAVCGPNNDILTVPTQPKGLSAKDSGWANNGRTFEFVTAEGYALAEGAQARLTFTDANIPCDVEPVGTTLVLRFVTSDGGTLEGEAFQFYAPVASQVTQQPWAQGEIGTGNVITLEEITAGSYRIVVTAEGYEPIDETIIVIALSDSEEHVITVTATQPVETLTPSPTALQTQSAITGLPQTGSGSSNSGLIMLLTALTAGIGLFALGSRRLNVR